MMLKIHNLHVESLLTKSLTLSDMNAEFSEGTISLIAGRNGAGKSSLISAISGHPSLQVQGDIFIGETNVTHLSPADRALAGLFVAHQHVVEIPGLSLISVLHNSYVRRHGDIDILIFKKNVEEKMNAYGIAQYLLSRDIFTGLSGGEKKLTQIISALALNPSILILDEPDSGADLNTQKIISTVCNDLKKEGKVVIIVSHNSAFTQLLNIDTYYSIENNTIKKS